jgi:DNA-binding PadR family transcriptional regulator
LDSLFALNRSTAYFLLDRLAQRGLVEAELEREGRRPERRVYRLTAEGKDSLQAALREHLADYKPGRYPDEVGLLFLEMLPRQEQKSLLEEKLKAVRERQSWAEERRSAHAGTPARWMLGHRVAHLQAEEHWLRETLAELESTSSVVTEELEMKSKVT